MARRRTNTLLVYGIIAGLAALVVYDQVAGASSYTPIQLSAGVSVNIPAPPGGQVALELPAGAKGWLKATRQTTAAVTPVDLPLPPGPGASLNVAGVAAGSSFYVEWLDENSASQQAFVIFQAPTAVSGVGLLAGAGWHPLMRTG